MGSSGGGGGGKAPAQAVPSGAPIFSYGGSAPFDPSRIGSVLPDSVTPMTPEMMSGAWARNAAAAAAAPPPPPSYGGGPGGPGMPGAMDGFAQKVLDAQKQQRLAGMMLQLDPRRGGQYMQAMQAMPKASSPSEQLMLQALQQRQAGGGTRRMQSSR